jgi:hypothetical protein
MNTWEDILNQYLEGDVLRADVESLRWKIALPDAARDEIDRDLKLVDDLYAAAELVAPPAGAADRLIEAIRRAPAPKMPSHWRMTAGGPAAIKPVEPEDDEIGLDRVKDFTEIENELTDLGKSIPYPEGAVERLFSRLGPQSDSPAGETGGEVGKDTGPIMLFPPNANLKPDALAASKETEEEEEKDGENDPGEKYPND